MIRYAAPRSEDYVGRHRDNSTSARIHCTIADRIAKTSEAYDQWAYEGKHRRAIYVVKR